MPLRCFNVPFFSTHYLDPHSEVTFECTCSCLMTFGSRKTVMDISPVFCVLCERTINSNLFGLQKYFHMRHGKGWNFRPNENIGLFALSSLLYNSPTRPLSPAMRSDSFNLSAHNQIFASLDGGCRTST